MGTPKQEFPLRDYQQEGKRVVLDLFRYERRVLVVWATGLGKTILIAHIAKEWAHGRVLVIAHRDELIQQAAAKIFKVTGEWPSIEQGTQFSDESSIWGRSQFVVASVQSLHERRLTEGRFNDVGLLVIDEAHHAAQGNASYGRIVGELEKRNPNLRVLGLTATPDRRDGKRLLFDVYAARYRLREAIHDGWLCDIRNKIVVVKGMDLSRVHKTNGDLNPSELAAALEQEEPLQEIAVTTAREAGDAKCIIFCATLAQAEAVTSIINRIKPGKARWISGDQQRFPKQVRRELLKQFESGEVQFLANMGVLIEGFDDPGVGLISWARPTTSDSIYTQGIGRGTRVLEGVLNPGMLTPEERKAAIAASAKPFIRILDFVDQSRRSDLVTACSPEILGGYFSEAEIERAKSEIAKKSESGEECDVESELEAARKAIQQEEEAEAARRRREEEEERKRREEERRKHLVADVEYELQDYDPFNQLDKGAGIKLGGIKGKPVTEKQAALLDKYGINPNAVNRKQAQGIINQIRQGKLQPRQKASAQRPVGRSSGREDEANRLLREAASR